MRRCKGDPASCRPELSCGLARFTAQDERGALGVMGLLLTLVLVALVYACLGIGRVLLEREGLQDAADAAAFSGAVMQARGMNLLAFINLVMAALVAILIALRLAQSLCVIAAGILTGMAWFTAGTTLALAGVATQQAANFAQAFKQAKGVVFPILKGLHTTQRAVKVVVPWVSSTDALTEAAKHHPPAVGAFAVPGSVSLPVEADNFPVLCEHGAEMSVDLALFALPDGLRDIVSDAAGEIAESTSKFLCGDGSGKPPTHKETIDEWYPRPPGARSCEAEPQGETCKGAQLYAQRAQPQSHNGDCSAVALCEYGDPYETLARTARLSCEARSGFQPKEYVWQEHEVSATYRFVGGAWKLGDLLPRNARLRTTARPPCGKRGLLSEDWNADSGSRHQELPDALCTEDISELLPPTARPGATRQLVYHQATRLFSCVVEVTKEFPLAEKEDALGKGGEKRSPHRVEEKLKLGGEEFLVRAVALGPKPSPGQMGKWVELAPGKGGNSLLLELGSELGRVSVAEAEYYFDHKGNTPPAEWLWEMRWTARLRRFRVPEAKAKSDSQSRKQARDAHAAGDVQQFGGNRADRSTADACRAADGDTCEKMDSLLEKLDDLVIH